MRKEIHPEYVECKVTCSCGNAFETRSTKPELHVELCSECHPFYTGKQKFVDTGGRVQRFSDKFGNAAAAVREREAAAREERRKAAEEAALKAREEREAKESVKAGRRAGSDTGGTRRSRRESASEEAEAAPATEDVVEAREGEAAGESAE